MVNNKTSSLSKWTYYEVDPPPGLRESSAIIYLAIIITNILILVTFRRMRKLMLQHNLMIFIALVDLLTVPAQVPVMVALWNKYILLTDVLCNAISIFNHSTLAATTWLHIAICIEKYFSISMPIQHKLFLTRYKASLVATTITLVELSVILAMMTVFTITKYLNSYFRTVLAFCGYAFSLNYVIAVVVPFVVLPLVVVFVSHTLILREIRRSGTQRRRRLLKGMKTVALTVGAYYICWIPFSVNSVVESLFPQSESASSDIPIIVAVYFVISNSAMNFLVYIHSIEQFREQFKGLFCIRNRRRVHCNVPDRTKSSDGRTKGAKITTVQPCDTRITKL